MNELIKYFEALEARLAAQEERIAQLESSLAEKNALFEQMSDSLSAMTQLSEEANKNLIEIHRLIEDGIQVSPEPEVDVELVYPEDEEVTVELPQEEPAAEPAPAPAPAPQPEAPHVPQQTSLFGTPVSDIRQAVSIGDRFLFQRELFGGNAEKLQQTLTELNALHSFDEAIAFVENFSWDKQSPTYELFVNVLHRRFQ